MEIIKKMSGCHELGEGEIKRTQKIFREEDILCDAILVDIDPTFV